ncbi:MAG: glycoside hydrolase family 16 protein [Bryobacterales bacterium]|nr:glycoside hydrolase family 16 protein [Bryobacterales bacterium]
MKHLWFALCGLLCCAVAAPQLCAQTPVWSDEFSGPARSAPDPSKWVHDLGATGWGNAELQNYTDSRENSFLDGKGHLIIRAIKTGDMQFTSARLKTSGKYAVRYGRIEARMKLPFGQGIWPAFWMLGNQFPSQDWPQCGEIDIMEHIGKEPSTIYGTIHGPGYSGSSGMPGKYASKDGKPFSDGFHVYGVDWREGEIRFLVDGNEFSRVRRQDIPAGKQWVFDEPFFLLLNLAVGGRWPGYPDATSNFPQDLTVDWVRVYQ